MYLSNSEKCEKACCFWRDSGKMVVWAQIPDLISGPITSWGKYKNKADMLGGEGPSEGQSPPELSKGRKPGRATLSQVREEAGNWWQGRLDFSSSLGQRPIYVSLHSEEPRQWKIQGYSDGLKKSSQSLQLEKDCHIQPERPTSREFSLPACVIPSC